MRIPFDIKYRPQIESGEYKVETRDGRKARIIHWDLNCTSPIVAVMDAHIDLPGEIVDVFSVSGRAFDDLESPSDLFIVTPEPELSEFEKVVSEFAKEVMGYTFQEVAGLRNCARQLMIAAREQFIKDGYVIEKKAFHDAVENISDKHRAEMSVEYSLHCKIEEGTRHAIMNWEAFQKVAQKFIDIGKAEALRTRAIELTENLVKSGLDKDSIPYHLIEFMCNLYDCQNWKEIEGSAEAYTTRIKAVAMKDLPRWRKWENGACGNGQGIPLAIVKRWLGCYKLVDALGIQGEQYIMLSDLEKLPGFKED